MMQLFFLLALAGTPADFAAYARESQQFTHNGEAEFYLNGQLVFARDPERPKVLIGIDLDHMTTATVDAYYGRETPADRARTWDENAALNGPHADGDVDLEIDFQLPPDQELPDPPGKVIERGRVIAHDGRFTVTDLDSGESWAFVAIHAPRGPQSPENGIPVIGFGRGLPGPAGPKLEAYRELRERTASTASLD